MSTSDSTRTGHMNLHACTHAYVHTCAYAHTHVHVYTCTHTHVHMHSTMHTYMYTCIHTHAHVHAHAHTHSGLEGFALLLSNFLRLAFPPHTLAPFRIHLSALPRTPVMTTIPDVPPKPDSFIHSRNSSPYNKAHDNKISNTKKNRDGYFK